MLTTYSYERDYEGCTVGGHQVRESSTEYIGAVAHHTTASVDKLKFLRPKVITRVNMFKPLLSVLCTVLMLIHCPNSLNLSCYTSSLFWFYFRLSAQLSYLVQKAANIVGFISSSSSSLYCKKRRLRTLKKMQNKDMKRMPPVRG